MSLSVLLAAFASLSAASAASAQDLFAAVLPQARSVQVGAPATAFATIINNTTRNLTNCGIALATSIPATFKFVTVDSSNRVNGVNNQRVPVAAGASQGFVFELIATAPITTREARFTFQCSGTAAAPVFPGVNTFMFGASATPVPDILSIGSVLSNDSIVSIPGVRSPATGVMSVAAINLAANADRDLRVVPVLSNTSIAADAFVCETNPLTGACLQPPAASITSRVKLRTASSISTYSVFVRARGAVAFAPDRNLIALRFLDTGNAIRGATSAAVRTRDLISTDNNNNGRWDDVEQFAATMLGQMIPNGASLNGNLAGLQVNAQDGMLLSDLTDLSINYGQESAVQIACLMLRTNDANRVSQYVAALQVAMQSNSDRADTLSVATKRAAEATYSWPTVTAADCN